jgi:hypothetical protein
VRIHGEDIHVGYTPKHAKPGSLKESLKEDTAAPEKQHELTGVSAGRHAAPDKGVAVAVNELRKLSEHKYPVMTN